MVCLIKFMRVCTYLSILILPLHKSIIYIDILYRRVLVLPFLCMEGSHTGLFLPLVRDTHLRGEILANEVCTSYFF